MSTGYFSNSTGSLVTTLNVTFDVTFYLELYILISF